MANLGSIGTTSDGGVYTQLSEPLTRNQTIVGPAAPGPHVTPSPSGGFIKVSPSGAGS